MHRLLSGSLPRLLRISLLARQLECADPWVPEPLLLALQKVHRSCTMQKRADLARPWTDSGMLDFGRTLLQPAFARHDDIKQQVAHLEREISATRAAITSLDGVIAQARVELEREAECLTSQLSAPELRSADSLVEPGKAGGHSASAGGERTSARGTAHLKTSLITIAAQTQTLAEATAAIAKARVEFVSELEDVVTLANAPLQQTSGSSSVVAFSRIGRSSEPIQIQAVAARVRQLERGSVMHAAREAAFRESCVRIQTAVENHIGNLMLASDNPGFLRSADL